MIVLIKECGWNTDETVIGMVKLKKNQSVDDLQQLVHDIVEQEKDRLGGKGICRSAGLDVQKKLRTKLRRKGYFMLKPPEVVDYRH